MKVYHPQDIFNIAVVGHGGEGKTTLVEAMLYDSGAIERMGRVEDGNTATDYDGEEVKRQISIGLALAPVEWKNKKINLIDAPGYFDFEGEAVAAYELCDSALIVLSANGTVPVGAQKAYDYCSKHEIPRAFLVNQVDKEHADYMKTVAALGTKYTSAITAVQMPVMQDGKFVGIVDIIGMKAYLFDGQNVKEAEIPADCSADAESLRETLVENAAGNDEELMEKFFDGQELSTEDILKGLRAGILQGSIAPVFVSAAAPNTGVRELMDEMIALMPNAAEMPGTEALDAAGNSVTLKIDTSAPFTAHVLKTIADPFVGKLSIIKIVQGTLKSDMSITNANTGKPEKCSGLGVMRGKKLINIGELEAGDIGAVAKLQHTATGDTLCSTSCVVKFPPLDFPEPCICLAVGAKKKGEEEKVFSGLHRLEDEDPTFKLVKDTETGDMLANGMGEMHLEVINNKLKSKFNVEGELHDPRIPYREAIKKAVKAQGKHKKQSGGHGQYGDVWIEFSPVPDGLADFVFEDKIVGGVVPRQYIPAVEKGLKESIRKGVLAGYPVVGLKCTLYDGSYHTVDSSEMAFKVAANLAFKKGIAEANPVLLEPIMKVVVTIPDEYMGDIIGDLNRRRGRILGMNPLDGVQEVTAEVPLSELFKYATDLRSMTQARGTFKQTFERYEEVPAQMAGKIIEQAKKDMEE
ncbi:elongation factor G [Christensenella intestinihominis]|uniref:elongation factor G n=1 Tax=Christensenella intestinihominis TaxID=1851429 RepID=UPI00083353D3|nr:elongation factor G [Christensenella intestinihominis]